MNTKQKIPNQQSPLVFRSSQDTGTGIFKGRNVSQTISGLGLVILVESSSISGYALQIADSPQTGDYTSDHVVTGTLDQLDFDNGKGLLKTDLGKPVFFDIVVPDLFRRLSIGQRVTIGINDQGQATKVMDIPPAELPSSGPH